MEIFDLHAERLKRGAPEEPEPEFVSEDEFGRPLSAFGVSYELDGQVHTFHLNAYDFVDAEERVEAIRASGELIGQADERLPDGTGSKVI